MMKIKLNLIETSYKNNSPYNLWEINRCKKLITQNLPLRPIIVQECLTPNNYLLIAGGEYFEAYKQLGRKEIEAIILPRQIDNVALREISIYNNLPRDLVWWEEVVLQKRLHEIRIKQHGKSQSGNPHGIKIGWGMRDTAAELGISVGNLQKNLKLADVVELNSKLKKIKNKEQAIELVKEIGGLE